MITLSSGQLQHITTQASTVYNINVAENFSDIVSIAFAADQNWIPFRHKIFQANIQPILDGKSQDEIAALLALHNIEDLGWQWQRKAMTCSTSDYLWFCLEIAGVVQGVAVLLHPHQSYLFPHNVFYIDYLASAPWNRQSPTNDKEFSGIGSILLAACTNYCIDFLKYTPGFNLHSLPRAETYYINIGMTDAGIDPAKQNLRKFEMIESNCQTFLQRGTRP